MRTRSGKLFKSTDKAKEIHSSSTTNFKKAAAVTGSNKLRTGSRKDYNDELREKDDIISNLAFQLEDAQKKIDSDRSKIQDLLSCDICIEIIRKPYMLPTCGHTFCLDCIIQWSGVHNSNMSDNANSEIPGESGEVSFPLQCPNCQVYETAQVRKNFFVQSLVDALLII